MIRTSGIMLAALLLFFGIAFATNASFKIVNEFTIEGTGRWDYVNVDAESRRVYMSRTTHVSVFDADSGKLVGDIPDTPGVHGVAVAPDLGVGFVTAGAENKVTVFDLTNFKVLGKIATGKGPDSILYHPPTQTIFIQNGKDNSTTVIDARSREVVATIPLSGKPEFAAYEEGTVFVNIEDKNSIAVVDAAAKKVRQTWELQGCEEPSGLAIDRKAHNLFVACGNAKMAIVSSRKGEVTQTVSIGNDCDATAFDPGTGYAFASSGEGRLTVVRKSPSGKYEVAGNVETKPGSKTMGIDIAKHRVYLPAAKFSGDPTKRPRPSVVEGTLSMLVVGQ